jgi:hypothetical protein
MPYLWGENTTTAKLKCTHSINYNYKKHYKKDIVEKNKKIINWKE